MVSVGSFHSRSGSSAQLDTGDVHVCHICLKQFSRRDLRERHRRRCEKSIGKVIPTKKRSCERCISFKVKCGYEKPSCSRCVSRSVPCEYKLEPRVKLPLNPAFGLGPNPAFSGSMDVFSVQQNGSAEMDGVDPQQGSSSSLAAGDMSFDLSSSSASTEAMDTTLDLVGQGFYTGNEYYQHWSHQDGSSSNDQHTPWDATTVWSDGSSSIHDPVMLDEVVHMDPAWTQNMLDPTMCMDTYGEHNMAYYSQGMQQAQYSRSGKRHGKSTSISY